MCLLNTTVRWREVFTLYNSAVEGGVYFIQQCSGGRCLLIQQ